MPREPYEHVAQTLTVVSYGSTIFCSKTLQSATRGTTAKMPRWYHYAPLMFSIYALSVRLKARISGHPPQITRY
jgi:hypothetical protein